MGNLSKKAADRILTLKEDLEDAQEKIAELESKLAQHERRQQAEEIVLEAREADQAPDRMKAASVDRFLALRAELEDKDGDELQKVATTVSMWNDDDGGIFPSEWPDSNEPGDFNEWIKKVTV